MEFYQQEKEGVLKALKADVDRGLSLREIEKRKIFKHLLLFYNIC